jgi:hypothetical protein
MERYLWYDFLIRFDHALDTAHFWVKNVTVDRKALGDDAVVVI